eukprot:m.169046 g.169046  ORF g.169046 m.169046 type:complete len:398 (+) comp25098_c0_seq5:225-1418(+)
MYAMCFQAQTPLLPFLLKESGASGTGYGSFMTVFNVVQFIGALISGRLVDIWGANNVLIISFIASALCYGMQGFSKDSGMPLVMIYLSRLPTVLQHAVLAARAAVVARSADSASRSAAIGYVGVAYGIGMVIGPSIGGYVGDHFGLAYTAYLAMIGSLLSICSLLFLPEQQRTAVQDDEPPQRDVLNDFQPGALVKVVLRPEVTPLVTLKTLLSVACALYQSIFGLILSEQLNLTPTESGRTTSLFGVLLVICQGVLIKPTSRYFGADKSMQIGTVLLSVSLFVVAFCNDIWSLSFMLAPITYGVVVISTINTSQLSEAVPEKLVGSILAIDMAISNLARITTNYAASYIFTEYSPMLVPMTSAVLLVLCFLFQRHPSYVRSREKAKARIARGDKAK